MESSLFLYPRFTVLPLSVAHESVKRILETATFTVDVTMSGRTSILLFALVALRCGGRRRRYRSRANKRCDCEHGHPSEKSFSHTVRTPMPLGMNRKGTFNRMPVQKYRVSRFGVQYCSGAHGPL